MDYTDFFASILGDMRKIVQYHEQEISSNKAAIYNLEAAYAPKEKPKGHLFGIFHRFGRWKMLTPPNNWYGNHQNPVQMRECSVCGFIQRRQA